MNGQRTTAVKDLVFIALFAALMALGGRIKTFDLFGVPFTLQVMFAFLAGALLGPGKGVAAVSVYLLMGLLGAPVFASAPFGGLVYYQKPTFGFLLGFAAQAWVTGAISRRLKGERTFALILGGLAGVCALYLIGVPYFSWAAKFFLGMTYSIGDLIRIFLPFVLLLDSLKIIAASGLVKALVRTGHKF
ncbi:MAG: biotin transporter BioY [Bacillota bacterium]